MQGGTARLRPCPWDRAFFISSFPMLQGISESGTAPMRLFSAVCGKEAFLAEEIKPLATFLFHPIFQLSGGYYENSN